MNNIVYNQAERANMYEAIRLSDGLNRAKETGTGEVFIEVFNLVRKKYNDLQIKVLNDEILAPEIIKERVLLYAQMLNAIDGFEKEILEIHSGAEYAKKFFDEEEKKKKLVNEMNDITVFSDEE